VLEVPDQQVFIRPSETRWRYGSIGLGLDQAPLVWKDANHIFASHDSILEHHKQDQGNVPQLGSPHRVSSRILDKHPVDCLLVEGWDPAIWHPWVERATPEHCPKIVLSWTTPKQLGKEEGVWKKTARKAMDKMGYHTTYWFMEAWKYGAALDQTRLAVVHYLAQPTNKIPSRPAPAELPVRPMSNLLMPVSIPHKARCCATAKAWRGHEARHHPCQVTRRVGSSVFYDEAGAMPEIIASWIGTDRGV
jgi:hypothetical protein